MDEGEAQRLARHDLLRVAPDAWRACLSARCDLDGVPHLADWAHLGRPVIVRRRDPGEAGGGIPVGLPLPPGDGKRRIGLTLPAAALSRHPALALASARNTAPATWRPAIEAVLMLGGEHGLVPRVYGSLLWQALTGLAYLTAASDLDLLWPVSGCVEPEFLRALAEIEAGAAMRLDGEIVVSDGGGINWRELLGASRDGTVVAKAREGLSLRPAAPFLSEGAP